ncbi:MAG: DUF2961 domain-containing protein [Kiritimatiellaeota bacterium]|nr:DUF2961 domain-containing protein [Kiritimatiellota bacterium]
MNTKRIIWVLSAMCAAAVCAEPFNGIGTGMGNLFRLSDAKTRSVSPENFTGEKGKAAMAGEEGSAWHAARDLGQGWKVSPFVRIKAKDTFTLADIDGPGCIQQIWLTPAPMDKTRGMILRFYWDGEAEPSIETPLGDFFACGWARYCQINSLAVCVNPGSAFNCYWQMPFRQKARVTVENLHDNEITIYYQINYALTPVPDDAAYLHAQFRRENPLANAGAYTLLDGVTGKGHYVGTYMAWGVNSPGWWGEGEIKFYMDGDKDFPTIAGTGTEDYFCGSYNFHHNGRYTYFSTPYAGLVQVIPDDQYEKPGQRFGLYRWHITDPVRFDTDLKVTMQALGWQDGGRYLPLKDDISSVAFWYQAEPHNPFPNLPPRDQLELK